MTTQSLGRFGRLQQTLLNTTKSENLQQSSTDVTISCNTKGCVNPSESSEPDKKERLVSEHYVNKAIKLLRLHNEIVEALNRYRRGGEQKIIVQHNVMADKAVVNFPGGANSKNEGDTPCSTNYAELKPELTPIDHADNPLWPIEGVDCTAVKVQVPNRKKARNA